jgi:hypothetical protein
MPNRLDAVSPELVLVDPDLAARARCSLTGPTPTPQALAGNSDAPPALHEPVPARPPVEMDAALRRLTESVIDSLSVPVEPLARWDARLVGRLLAGAAAAGVTVALAGGLHASWTEPAAPAESAVAGLPPSGMGEGPSPSRTVATATAPASPSARTPRARASAGAFRSETDPETKPSANRMKLPLTTANRDSASSSTRSSRDRAWASVARATAYHVEILRGGERVFVTTTTKPRVRIPASWDLGGRPYRLRSGDRLSVWALVSGKRMPRAIVARRPVVLARR